jgi:hypothetical protein
MFVRTCRRTLVVTAVVLLAACATGQPIYNVSQTSIVTNKPNPTSDDVRQAIIRAGTGLNWQMKAEGPGRMTGRLALRTHLAVVDVSYDSKSYSLRYKDSQNLDYNGSTIHRNYNSWIQNLDRAIQAQLTAL